MLEIPPRISAMSGSSHVGLMCESCQDCLQGPRRKMARVVLSSCESHVGVMHESCMVHVGVVLGQVPHTLATNFACHVGYM